MASDVTTPVETHCARHPRTPTLLRCNRCGTPICPRCMVSTEVGQRCPDCARARRLPTFDVSAGILARGAAAGLLAATAIAFLWGLLPGFSFWLGLLMGFVTGEAISWAANRKRGQRLMILAVACVLLGFVIGYAMLGRGAGLAVLVNPLLLLRLNLFTLIGLGLASFIAALRQRG